MRIIYLHQYFVTPEMAGGTRSYEMARRLVAAGHEVHMITSDQTGEVSHEAWKTTEAAGIQVHWTPLPYRNDMSYAARIGAFLRFAWRAGKRAAQIDGDLVFASSTPLTIAIPAVYAARRRRIPMVFEIRDLWPAVPIAIGAIRNPVLVWASRWLERFAYRNSARVVALAPGMRDEVVASGYPREQTEVIPNGSDLDLFADSGASESVRRDHAWLRERPLLVYTGAFGRINGMDYLVKLAAAVRKLDAEVRIVGIGEGGEFESTMQLATELGVLDDNLFLLGRLPKVEAARWVRAADMTIALITGPEIVWRDAVQNKFLIRSRRAPRSPIISPAGNRRSPRKPAPE